MPTRFVHNQLQSNPDAPLLTEDPEKARANPLGATPPRTTLCANIFIYLVLNGVAYSVKVKIPPSHLTGKRKLSIL